jgi:cobalt/nickel transport system permease protein
MSLEPTDSPSTSRDATGRWLLATLAFVILVVTTPFTAWKWLIGEAALLAVVIAVSRTPILGLLRRWLTFLPLVGFLALTVAPGHPDRPILGLPAVAALLLVRNSLAFLAVITLSTNTGFLPLLRALRRFRVPSVLVGTLYFMYRYVHVLSDERDRMLQARRARSFGRNGLLEWPLLAGLIAVLFLRSLERGERVHDAMLSRGWDGTLKTLDGTET